LYKRFVKTWICFTNPWIRFVSWSRILTPKRFVLCLKKRILDSNRIVDHESWLKKICFELLITNPVNFQRFTCFYESNKSLRIFSTTAQNKSVKIEICESESLQILKFRIRKSGFVNPNLKDSFRGFDSRCNFQKIRFVDSFRKKKKSKRFVSYWFGRIRVQIPHPYQFIKNYLL
jgi:hypothetical protein